MFRQYRRTLNDNFIINQGVIMGKQRVPIEQFKMPFGKYQGQKLADIYYKDKEYLEWCAEKFEPGNNVGERVREFLDKMAGYDRAIEAEEQAELDLDESLPKDTEDENEDEDAFSSPSYDEEDEEIPF